MKYPGAFIINEYGTNKELAKIYGVSERTIYRWKTKAKKETGERVKRPTRPRMSTLQKFKGTRKELAKKYGVSERTAYRWLQSAREKGVEIESRQKKVKYPGTEILELDFSNKELAQKYNVSERTISRWKRRALSEIALEEPFEILPPDEEPKQEQQPPDEEDFFKDNFDFSDDEDYQDNYKDPIEDIYDILNEYELINEKSPYRDLPPEIQRSYLLMYLSFQHDEAPWKWYEVFGDWELHLDDPNGLSMLNIWGDEFDSWVKDQIEIDKAFI